MKRPSVLLAVDPAALDAARAPLGEACDLVVVRTLGEALERLARGGIDVIVADLHFDDSSMPMLLDAVKAHPAARALPFVCCRLLPSMLLHASLGAARQVCGAFGAEFIDVLEIERREGTAAAAAALRAAVGRAQHLNAA
jgi:CheY-like chemotaxis protein